MIKLPDILIKLVLVPGGCFEIAVELGTPLYCILDEHQDKFPIRKGEQYKKVTKDNQLKRESLFYKPVSGDKILICGRDYSD